MVRPLDVPAKPKTRRPAKGRIKSSTVAIYASVFVLLVAVIAVGYRAPQESATIASAAPLNASAESDTPAVNDVIATSIAASVASAADLAVAPNVSELAVSTRVQSQYAGATENSSATKPVIVQLSSASRSITSYKAVEGDTVQTIAAKFSISADSVRWANNLTGDTVAVGSTLDIVPRDGIIYVVKDGDTIEKIADKYKADPALIATYNDLELNGLTAGLKIVVPNGVLPTEERPGYVAPVRYSSYTSFGNGYITGVGAWSGQVLSMRLFYGVDANSGGYAPGNCTAYAFYRRAQLGMPIPRMMGNASSWATSARNAGLLVDKTPSFGAVIQAGNHVGVVEDVLPNGDLRITDMNYGYRIYNLAERIIPASTVHNYMFIH